MSKKTIKCIAVGLLSAALLSACGGGGGGGSGTPSVDRITPINGTAADLTHNSTSQKVASDVSTVPGSVSGVVSSSNLLASAAQPVSAPSAQGMPMGALSAELVRIALRQSAKARTLQGVAQSATCDNGGSVTAEANVRNDFYLNAGDTLRLSARDCHLNVSSNQAVWLHGEFNFTVMAGSYINPDSNLAGLTLGIEMTPINVKMFNGVTTTLDVGLDARFKIAYAATGLGVITTITPLNAGDQLTERVTQQGFDYKTTLSNFDISVRDGTGLGQMDINGHATVNTNRINLTNATQYTWSTSSWITTDPNARMITSGTMVLTSLANNARIRLVFGQTCANTNGCVQLAKDDGSGIFTPVNTYSWNDYVALNQ